MGLIATGGATTTVEIPGDGPFESQVNISTGIPAIVSEIFQGNVPEDALEASLGASFARGGLVAWDVGLAYVPDTSQATVEIRLAGFGVGGSVAV